MNDELRTNEIVENEDPTPVSTSETPEVDVTPLKNFLYGRNGDVTQDAGEKMAFVWDFYSKQADGPGEALGIISDLEKSLASPPEGVSRIDNIYSYTLLLSQQKDIGEELRAYRKY